MDEIQTLGNLDVLLHAYVVYCEGHTSSEDLLFWGAFLALPCPQNKFTVTKYDYLLHAKIGQVPQPHASVRT